jgi:hypothetical protein
MSDPKQPTDQDDEKRTAEDLPDGSGPAGHATQEDGDDDQFQG